MALVNDRQVGAPSSLFARTKAQISALSGLQGGEVAYASDTHEFGFYNGAQWQWFTAPGGVTDHGALTGLADDDHPQYFNQARGDARYALIGQGGGVTDHGALTGLGDDDHPQYYNAARHNQQAHYGFQVANADNALTLAGYGYTHFAVAGHNHDGVYSPVGHNHDGIYTPYIHYHNPRVSLFAKQTSGQVIPNDAWTIVNYDTGSASGATWLTGSSWKFYLPFEGAYIIEASVMFNAAAWSAANQVAALALYVNGSQYAMLGRWDGGAADGTSSFAYVSGCRVIWVQEGGVYVDVRAIQRYGSDLALWAADYHNMVNIVKIG